MAALVQRVLGQTRIHELFIEGGATARAILDCMGWETLTVLGEYGPGVVRLSVQGPEGQVVTLKPGSLPWPEGLLDRKRMLSFQCSVMSRTENRKLKN